MRILRPFVKLPGKMTWLWFISALVLPLMMVIAFTTQSAEAG